MTEKDRPSVSSNLRVLPTTTTPPPPETNKVLIDHLEKALADAKAGKIIHGAFAAESDECDSLYWFTSASILMAGIISEMQWTIMDKRDKA